MKNAAGQERNAAGIGMTSQRTRARMVERLREQGIRDARVLGALGAVPRHLFVEEALASRAYEDTALPIGFGQTISQPYVVARMIEALIEQKIAKKILEVGTGCGYQAAVLASIFREVYSIERIKGLLERARISSACGSRICVSRTATATPVSTGRRRSSRSSSPPRRARFPMPCYASSLRVAE